MKLPSWPLPLGGSEAVVDKIYSPRVGSPLLPALRQIRGARHHVAKWVDHCIVASRAMAISGEQAQHNLSLDQQGIGGVREQIKPLVARVL